MNARGRAILVVLALVMIAGAAVAVGSPSDGDEQATSQPSAAREKRSLTILNGERLIASVRLDQGKGARARQVRALLSRHLPALGVSTRRSAHLVFRYDRDAAVQQAVALGAAGGAVQVRRRPLASRIDIPVVRQNRRNTCESAALEMLLRAAGRRVSQQRLQSAFPTSGPLDPTTGRAGRVWGDPDRGYVGRPDGGGVAGGFGVFPGPVADTAKRFGVSVDVLTGASVGRIYERVRRGRAVMVWIGLSDGPYGRWRSPAGRRVRVNFGEHTVVLTGMMRDGRLRVHNPLEGTKEVWTRARFEASWALLGHRALGV